MAMVIYSKWARGEERGGGRRGSGGGVGEAWWTRLDIRCSPEVWQYQPIWPLV